jgi:hypothetical protein
VANVETINVSGMTYYRLKLGAYQNQIKIKRMPLPIAINLNSAKSTAL